MKRFFYLSLFFLVSTFVEAQTLFVANINLGAKTGVNVFTGTTSIVDAMAAASNGDIIYIVPSPIQHPAIIITKELTLFGIGLKPNKDLASLSVIGDVSIRASNVRFSGIFASNITFDDVNPISGITIENSNILNLVQTGSSLGLDQLLVRNNILRNLGIYLVTSSNVTISNNIFSSNPLISGTIRGKLFNVFNNLFITNGANTATVLFDTDDCIFDHNIFYGVSLAIGSGSTGNVWDDNISFGGSNNVFPVGQFGNTTNTSNIEDSNPLFVNLPVGVAWSDSYDLTLQAGSPALNINGTDIGPSGGGTPFDSEGNILPLIQSVIIPAMVPAGSDLPVTIKAKGN